MNRDQQKALIEELGREILTGVNAPHDPDVARVAERFSHQDPWYLSKRVWGALVSLLTVVVILWEYFTGGLDPQTTLVLLGGVSLGGVAAPLRSKAADLRLPSRR